jgi:sugar phosphate isomerase/epimerase
MHDIKIGTLVPAGNIKLIPQLLEHGFESFAIFFWETIKGHDVVKLASDVKKMLEGTDAVVSCLTICGNPLVDCEKGVDARVGWESLIDAAEVFGTDLVTGFTGRVVGKPVPESISKLKEVFIPLAEKAQAKGVRLAFENCDMRGDWESGDWNIAFCPKAWELMFEALPYENIGLQWEPCHQLVQLTDPMPQLRKWVHKIFNVHGKDATVAWDIIRENGIRSGTPYVWHRTPGFGDSNWTDIISILRMGGFKGTIDIEGFHDPVYRNELEYTGQVHALNYLKQCRGGDFVCIK